MSLFSKVNVWSDETERSPAGQMAVDEAILRTIEAESDEFAFLRFYSWQKPATTLGFFMPIAEIPVGTEFVRRLTGGGIVEHGNDVTFALAVGKHHPLSAAPTVERYRVIHEALRDALIETHTWPKAELAPISATDSKRGELACFSKLVGWDVMNSETGEKIAGGAQRRSGGAWLHQGTVQISCEPSIFSKWTTLFAEKLGEIQKWQGDSTIETMAKDLEKSRYSTREWNERV